MQINIRGWLINYLNVLKLHFCMFLCLFYLESVNFLLQKSFEKTRIKALSAKFQIFLDRGLYVGSAIVIIVWSKTSQSQRRACRVWRSGFAHDYWRCISSLIPSTTNTCRPNKKSISKTRLTAIRKHIQLWVRCQNETGLNVRSLCDRIQNLGLKIWSVLD